VDGEVAYAVFASFLIGNVDRWVLGRAMMERKREVLTDRGNWRRRLNVSIIIVFFLNDFWTEECPRDEVRLK
jgi:hypothetical protein